ncbi:hypothetical protein KSP40_PGU003375 [Platanthera guangdongensis]|uniref:Uncharacterized protein n=1 Tax=Platanthera guangdongensis TaxID=2320717 RepID=A0ABR2MQF3_9ASPA
MLERPTTSFIRRTSMEENNLSAEKSQEVEKSTGSSNEVISGTRSLSAPPPPPPIFLDRDNPKTEVPFSAAAAYFPWLHRLIPGNTLRMMNPLCTNSGVHPPKVHCKSDDARLCLHCDAAGHSPNPISDCHVGTQLCGHCRFQPADCWSPDDGLALCGLCDLKASCPTQDELAVLLSDSFVVPVDGSCAINDSPFESNREPLKFEPTLLPSSLPYIYPDSNQHYSGGQDQTSPFYANGSNLATVCPNTPLFLSFGLK